MLSLSFAEARRFVTRYQLAPSNIQGVFDRLGTVQYDPLNPVGRNTDLVLQARVPNYRVDDWLRAVYDDRVAFDAWDKQACLVPISDWPMRRPIREHFHPWHDRRILSEHPDVVAYVFAEIDRRGPLSSLEFEDRRRKDDGNSWLGPTVVKRVLRALWARGELVTHHRVAGRHYYDRPERVIPLEHLQARAPADFDEYFRWIVYRRHVSAGLLRPSASPEIWSVCGDAATRARAAAELLEARALVRVEVGPRRRLYVMPSSALSYLNGASDEPRAVRFIGPLDALVWDRRAVREIFGFEYIWEVYKREPDRRWGYYVLPVLYGDRFIGRIDSRLEGTTWKIGRWWWEEGVRPDAEMLEALQDAAARFLRYLRAERLSLPTGLDRGTRQAFLGANKLLRLNT